MKRDCMSRQSFHNVHVCWYFLGSIWLCFICNQGLSFYAYLNVFLRRVLTGKQSRANVVNISMVDSNRMLYSCGIYLFHDNLFWVKW